MAILAAREIRKYKEATEARILITRSSYFRIHSNEGGSDECTHQPTAYPVRLIWIWDGSHIGGARIT